MTGCERILERLRQGPASAQELYALGVIAHSRVSDLRSRGYEIECALTDGLYIYSLLAETGGGPKSNAERMRAYRARHRDRVREADRARDRSDRYDTSPEQKRAWNLLSAAIRRGKVERQPCEVCGDADSQGHHDDYSKPLDVRWLCRPHHEELHHSGSRGLKAETVLCPSGGEGAAENSGTSARAPLPVRDPGLDELERPSPPLPLVGEGQLDIFAEASAA